VEVNPTQKLILQMLEVSRIQFM